MQCVAFILSLKKEHAAMEQAYKQERDVLTNRIASLVHIVDLSQQKLSSMTQALALKGLWKSMLFPYRHNFNGDVEKLDVIGGVALHSSPSSSSSSLFLLLFLYCYSSRNILSFLLFFLVKVKMGRKKA